MDTQGERLEGETYLPGPECTVDTTFYYMTGKDTAGKSMMSCNDDGCGWRSGPKLRSTSFVDRQWLMVGLDYASENNFQDVKVFRVASGGEVEGDELRSLRREENRLCNIYN